MSSHHNPGGATYLAALDKLYNISARYGLDHARSVAALTLRCGKADAGRASRVFLINTTPVNTARVHV